MKALVRPHGSEDRYSSALDVRETEIAIKDVKDFFERELGSRLNLTRVTSPLFVQADTGVNDNLNGTERPVAFDAQNVNSCTLEVVHSLAKWKRQALQRYGFAPGEGLYTDMNAIRRDETLDATHSIYVDQWDWEKVIRKEERHEDTLRDTVQQIYAVLKETERVVNEKYSCFQSKLPEDIVFISSQQLEDTYPELTSGQRERIVAEKHGAVFVEQIGGVLKSGMRHDGRSPDYDDWRLNGDIIVWNPVLQDAFELSSMGIRVDEESLLQQLEEADCLERMKLDFHQKLLNRELPYTLGGGIGQSRLCMFFLEKAHIGEVQASVWPHDVVEACREANIDLL